MAVEVQLEAQTYLDRFFGKTTRTSPKEVDLTSFGTKIKLLVNPFLRRRLGLSVSDVLNPEKSGYHAKHIRPEHTTITFTSAGKRFDVRVHEGVHFRFAQESPVLAAYFEDQEDDEERLRAVRFLDEGLAIWSQNEATFERDGVPEGLERKKKHYDLAEKGVNSASPEYLVGYLFAIREMSRLTEGGFSQPKAMIWLIKNQPENVREMIYPSEYETYLLRRAVELSRELKSAEERTRTSTGLLP